MAVTIKRDDNLFITNENIGNYYSWPSDVFLSRVVTAPPPSGNRIGAAFVDFGQGITMFGVTPEGPY